jgi:hypothetical protein
LFDGRLSGGRLSSLPQDGHAFDVAVDVPAGTYVVLAQMNMYAVSQRVYPGVAGVRQHEHGGARVTCDV